MKYIFYKKNVLIYYNNLVENFKCVDCEGIWYILLIYDEDESIWFLNIC